MNRTSKVLGFSVPPTLAVEVEQTARQEGRTKSELFREMWRVYNRYRLQRDRDEESWVMNLIEEAKAEQAIRPLSVEELLAESERLVSYGARQAKKLGIKPQDTERLIHEYRRARKA